MGLYSKYRRKISNNKNITQFFKYKNIKVKEKYTTK